MGKLQSSEAHHSMQNDLAHSTECVKDPEIFVPDKTNENIDLYKVWKNMKTGKKEKKKKKKKNARLLESFTHSVECARSFCVEEVC